MKKSCTNSSSASALAKQKLAEKELVVKEHIKYVTEFSRQLATKKSLTIESFKDQAMNIRNEFDVVRHLLVSKEQGLLLQLQNDLYGAFKANDELTSSAVRLIPRVHQVNVYLLLSNAAMKINGHTSLGLSNLALFPGSKVTLGRSAWYCWTWVSLS